jgi:hypothetical protein
VALNALGLFQLCALPPCGIGDEMMGPFEEIWPSGRPSISPGDPGAGGTPGSEAVAR